MHQAERSKETVVERQQHHSVAGFRPPGGFQLSAAESVTSFHISVLLRVDCPKLIYGLRYEAAPLS